MAEEPSQGPVNSSGYQIQSWGPDYQCFRGMAGYSVRRQPDPPIIRDSPVDIFSDVMRTVVPLSAEFASKAYRHVAVRVKLLWRKVSRPIKARYTYAVLDERLQRRPSTTWTSAGDSLIGPIEWRTGTGHVAPAPQYGLQSVDDIALPVEH